MDTNNLSKLFEMESDLKIKVKEDRKKTYGHHHELPDSHPIIQQINKELGIENTVALDENFINEDSKEEKVLKKPKKPTRKVKNGFRVKEDDEVDEEKIKLSKSINSEIEVSKSQVLNLIKKISAETFDDTHSNMKLKRLQRVSHSFLRALDENKINIKRF